jgi:inosine-uridine nucleoside N-ribohydrolase
MTHLHIDTDMGVDDGLALLYADRLGDLHALSTVFGNVPVDRATRNAQIFRDLLGRQQTLTIHEGADRASDGFRADAHHAHGDDGLGGATKLLEPVLVARAAQSPVQPFDGAVPNLPGPVTLIGIGPATNIPRLAAAYGRALERIVLMAGAFYDVGNITPTAEFNAYCDPSALQATLALGVPVTLVPLDVCRKLQLSRATVRAYETVEDSALMRLIVGAHMPYMDFYREAEGIDGCFPHDALAVLVALAPARFFHVRGRVTVDCSPTSRGRTTVAPGPSHVDIVTGGALKWARELLSRPPQRRGP